MNTKLIKYAVELANYGSYQKVANKHQISRSAVSRNIKRLEEDFGCTLFISFRIILFRPVTAMSSCDTPDRYSTLRTTCGIPSVKRVHIAAM